MNRININEMNNMLVSETILRLNKTMINSRMEINGKNVMIWSIKMNIKELIIVESDFLFLQRASVLISINIVKSTV